MKRVLGIIFFFVTAISVNSQNGSDFNAKITLDNEKKEGVSVDNTHYLKLEHILAFVDSSVDFSNITSKEIALQKCIEISNILEEKFKFTFHNTQLLSEGLQNSYLDCNYYSILFYSIFKRHGYDVSLIITPGHMFFRLNFNDGSHLNYETTQKCEKTDSEYIEYFGITEQALKNGLYMKSLSNDEIIATNLIEIANSFPVGQEAKKIELCNKALGIFPNCVIAFLTLASVKIDEEKYQDAVLFLEKALALDTMNYITYQHIGQLYSAQNKYKEAMHFYNKAIEFNPNDPDGFVYRSACWLDLGDIDQSMNDFDIAAQKLEMCTLFKFIYNYLALTELEQRIMNEYLKIYGK